MFSKEYKFNHFINFSISQGTYEYGEQVVQAALVLRRSCRFSLSPVHEREEMLEGVWEQVVKMIVVRGQRLEAAAEFFKSSEKVRFIVINN